jgi:hypothetical protein
MKYVNASRTLLVCLGCLSASGNLFAAEVRVAAPAYSPPACEDGFEKFTDVDASLAACPWIEKALLDGTTDGCTAGPNGRFCPDQAVTHAGLAVFVGKAQRRGRVAVVAKSGGDYTSPIAAMADLASWCETPGQGCLVKILPGFYELGTQPLVMVPGVDIEGSGEGTRLIGSGGANPDTGTVVGASNTELRSIRVHNGGGQFNRAVYANQASNFRLTQVTAIASAINGDYRAVLVRQGSTVLDHVTAWAQGIAGQAVGVANGSGVLTMIDSSALAESSTGFDAYGVLNYASDGLLPASAKLSNVTTQGRNVGVPFPVDLATGFGNACNGCFALLEHVQSIGGQIGGPAQVNSAYGFWNDATARAEIIDSYLLGTFGLTDEAGIYNNSSAASALRVRNSFADSGIASIANASTGALYVAYSELKGALTGGPGTWHCLGNYDENFASKACP